MLISVQAFGLSRDHFESTPAITNKFERVENFITDTRNSLRQHLEKKLLIK